MSWYNLSDGSKAVEETSFAAPEGGELFPNNTIVTAYIEEVKWTKGFETDLEYINLRWRIIAPEAYANRVHFQKLWVKGDNPQKDEGKAKSEGENTDDCAYCTLRFSTLGRLPTLPVIAT